MYEATVTARDRRPEISELTIDCHICALLSVMIALRVSDRYQHLFDRSIVEILIGLVEQ